MSGRRMKHFRRLSKFTGGGVMGTLPHGQRIWTDRAHRFYAFLKRTWGKNGRPDIGNN